MRRIATEDHHLIAIIALALILLLALMIPGYLSILEQTKLNHLVVHTIKVENALQQILFDLTDAETAERGYVITDDVSYLAPYQAALHSLPEHLRAMNALTRDNPLQQARLRQFDNTVQQRMAIIETIVQAQSQHHSDMVQAMLQQGDGKQVHDLSRRQVATMLATEHELLTQRQDTAQRNAQRYKVLIGASMAVSLLLIVFALWRLWHELRTLRSTEERLHNQITKEAELNRQLEALSESKLNRMTQLYAALSQCNQSIVRCTDEKQLFAEICRDAVNFGGMAMAWIGLIDPLNKLIKPVASFGTGVEYLDGLEISIDQDRSTWSGLTSLAIRDNQPVWCMDFQNDPITAAWHERGKRFGWGSLGALPLCRHREPIGAFIVYSHIINFFDEASRKLLIEMAMDINFALDRFASEAARHQAELSLQSSSAHLQLIIDTEPDCVTIVDPYGKLLEMNKAGLAMLEADTLAELKNRSRLDIVMPEYKQDFAALHQRIMLGKR